MNLLGIKVLLVPILQGVREGMDDDRQGECQFLSVVSWVIALQCLLVGARLLIVLGDVSDNARRVL